MWLKNKIIILSAAFVVSCSLGAMAQPPHQQRSPEEEATKQTYMLQRALALDSTQIDTIYSIHLRYAYLRRAEGCERECRDSLFVAMTAELKNVLTNEQYAKLLIIQQNHKRNQQVNPMYLRRDSLVSVPPPRVKHLQ